MIYLRFRSVCNHRECTTVRVINIANVVIDLKVESGLVYLDLIHDLLLLRETFVASATVVGATV